MTRLLDGAGVVFLYINERSISDLALNQTETFAS